MYSQTQINNIAKKFNYTFVDIIPFIEYDHRWPVLYRHLEKIKQDPWPHNEKILIQHYDTEFFLGDVGFSLYNFIKIIKKLDIDPSVFVVLTHYRGYTDKWLSYCDHPSNVFHVIELPFTGYILSAESALQPITHDCSYRFGSMIGLSRVHRDLLVKFLVQHDLLNNNIISVNLYSKPKSPNLTNREEYSEEVVNHNISGVTFLTTSPMTRINEEWEKSSYLQNIYNATDKITNVLHPSIPALTHPPTGHWSDCSWYKDFFVDIICESVYNYPYAFISEKTIRAIIAGRPFLLFGAANSLKYLQSLGFKTFNDFWSEEYDSTYDPSQRFELLCQLILKIKSWSIEHCQYQLKAMHSILDHNQQNYLNLIKSPSLYVTN